MPRPREAPVLVVTAGRLKDMFDAGCVIVYKNGRRYDIGADIRVLMKIGTYTESVCRCVICSRWKMDSGYLYLLRAEE